MKLIVNRLYAAICICIVLMLVSCGKDDNPVTPVNPPVSGAYIVGTATYSHYRELTNYNFLYPSTDPYGNTVMLSGTISMGPEVTKEKPAHGRWMPAATTRVSAL